MDEPCLDKPSLVKPSPNVKVSKPIKHSRTVKVNGREVEVAYRSTKPSSSSSMTTQQSGQREQ